MEIVLAALGAALTLFFFSYLLGDNPLFRLALHVFVGVSAAYICVVAIRGVILPALLPPDSRESAAGLLWSLSMVGGLLGALFMVRGVRGASRLGAVAVAILLGVGTAVAVGGAVSGTLVPQLGAATEPAVATSPLLPAALEPVGQIIAVVGTVTGMLFFSFSGPHRRRLANRLLSRGARVGRWFLLIGFGAVYGGVLAGSLAILADRIQYLVEVLEKLSSG